MDKSLMWRHGTEEPCGCGPAVIGALYGCVLLLLVFVMPDAAHRLYDGLVTAPLGRITLPIGWSEWLRPGFFIWIFWAGTAVLLSRWPHTHARFALAVMLASHYVTFAWTLLTYPLYEPWFLQSIKTFGIPDEIFWPLLVLYYPGQAILWAIIYKQARRYGFQFSLRALMFFVAAVAAILAWLASTNPPDWW